MIGEPLTQDRLCRLFNYDPETGDLRWRERPREDFISLRGQMTWNAKYAGKIAGYVDAHGYKTVGIDSRHYHAHRIIWCMVHGYWPDQVDHEEHNRADNRLDKLHEANNLTNRRNQKMHRSNTSGVVGVTWDRQCNKWRAQIGAHNKVKALGVFASKADAIARRKAAEVDLGFHPNHGRA